MPPSNELTYFEGRLYSEKINKEDAEKAKLIINIFLEIFKECEIVDGEMQAINKTETKNWVFLRQRLPQADRYQYFRCCSYQCPAP